jgi:O-antigen/teichoic acid export membrane protein
VSDGSDSSRQSPEGEGASQESLRSTLLPFWRQTWWWKRTANTFGGVFAGTLIAWIATIIAARDLGPGGYGRVALAMSVVGLIAYFLDLTLEEAIVHHGSKLIAQRDDGGLLGLLRAAFAIDALLGAFVFIIMFGAAEPISKLTGAGELDATLVRLAALGVLVTSVDKSTEAVLLLRQRPDIKAWAMTISAATRVVFVLAAVTRGGPESVLVAFAAAGAVGASLQGWLAWQQLASLRDSAKATPGWLRTWTRRLLRFGLHTSVSTSVTASREFLVPLTVGRLLGPESVGLISVAMAPVAAADVASSPIRMSLFPVQAELAARGDFLALKRSVNLYALGGLGLGIIGAVAGWIYLPVLIPAIYSDAFTPAIVPAQILMIAAVATLANGWAKKLPAVVGRPAVRTYISLVELVLVFGLLMVLADRGVKGVAAALSISAVIVAAIWRLWLLPRLLTRR